MIHFRTTVQIAPGRQADAVARAHEWAAIFKQANGVDMRVSVVTTGTLGRLCLSGHYDSMSAWEAAETRMWADPKGVEVTRRFRLHQGDGTSPFVPGTMHDEFWRDA